MNPVFYLTETNTYTTMFHLQHTLVELLKLVHFVHAVTHDHITVTKSVSYRHILFWLVVKAPFTDTLLKLSVLVSLPQKAEHVELFLPDLGGGKMIRLTVLKIVSAYSLSKA